LDKLSIAKAREEKSETRLHSIHSLHLTIGNTFSCISFLHVHALDFNIKLWAHMMPEKKEKDFLELVEEII